MLIQEILSSSSSISSIRLLQILTFLCISIFSPVISNKFSINLEYKASQSNIKLFMLNADWSLLSLLNNNFFTFTCNILDFSTKQVKTLLYPEFSIYKFIINERIKCFTGPKTQGLNGRNIFSFDLNHIDIAKKKDFLNSLSLFYIDNDDNISILDIKKRDFSNNEKSHFDVNLGSGLIEVQTIYGYKMYVLEKDETVSKSIVTHGMWQTNISRLIISITNLNDKVLHLGGHIGTFDILFGNLVGRHGKVYVFEPYPESFDMIERNILLNHMENIVIPIKKGGYSEKKEMIMTYVPDNTGATYISAGNHKENQLDLEIKVELVRIDEELKGEDFNIVMMDIEGCEIHAYNGMKKSLMSQKQRPLMIWEWGMRMIEKNNINKYGDYKSAMIELYTDFNYDVYILDLFIDIYVKVSPEDLFNLTDNQDIFLISRDDFNYPSMEFFSLIVFPCLPISDFMNIQKKIFQIKLKGLSRERCHQIIEESGLDKENFKFVCFSHGFCERRSICKDVDYVE